MVRQAPLRENRAAARDDAGDAIGGQRHVSQQNAGVNREIVDALFGLFDQRIGKELPRELLGLAADLFERLIDRDRTDRHGRVAQNPLAGFVDVLARREIHHRVGAPARRPRHLLYLFVDRRAHGRVADVGVDLHQEVPTDDHRLALGVIDVCRKNRASARDFAAHELRLDALAQRDELHLGRDLAARARSASASRCRRASPAAVIAATESARRRARTSPRGRADRARWRGPTRSCRYGRRSSARAAAASRAECRATNPNPCTDRWYRTAYGPFRRSASPHGAERESKGRCPQRKPSFHPPYAGIIRIRLRAVGDSRPPSQPNSAPAQGLYTREARFFPGRRVPLEEMGSPDGNDGSDD